MSGICGVADFMNKISPEEKQIIAGRMIDAMAYRGRKIIYHFPNSSIALASVQSAFQENLTRPESEDIRKEQQFLFLPDGIFFNPSGADPSLPNQLSCLQIKKICDQPGSIAELDGEFAFCLWNEQKHELLLGRDRFGSRPLFYYHQDGIFLFSSEIKSILASGLAQKEVNLGGVNDFLSYGYIPHPETIFRNIVHLEPGSYAIISARGFTKQNYWHFQFRCPDSPEPEDLAIERLRDALKKAVAKRLKTPLSAGAFLSGGLDSSIVCHLISALSGSPVQAFSIGFQEAAYSELPEAEIIAEQFKLSWSHRVVRASDYMAVLQNLISLYDSPFSDTSAIPSYYVAQMAAQKVQMVLTGDGPDQILAGSACNIGLQKYFTADPFLHRLLQALPIKRLFDGLSIQAPTDHFADKVKRTLYERSAHFNDYIVMGYIIPALAKRYLYSDDFFAIERLYPPTRNIMSELALDKELYPIERRLLFEINFIMHDDLMPKVEKTCTANGLEYTTPFRDKELVDLLETFPVDYRIRGTETKYLLKKAFEKDIPRQIVYKKKKGFAIPSEIWYRNELKAYIQDILFDERTLSRGYFNKKRLMQLLADYFAGNTSYYTCSVYTITSLLTLELWHRQYID